MRSAVPPGTRNLRLEPLGGESSSKPVHVVKSTKTKVPSGIQPVPTINPDDLIGQTYLTKPQEDGQQYRAKIVHNIMDIASDGEQDDIQFLVSIDGAKADELIAYSDVLDYFNEQDEELDPAERIWKFREITAHEGPLKPGDPSYKGSKYNVFVEWEDGSKTSEPLSLIGKDDPVTVAQYGACNGLLDEPGWVRFKKLAKREKKMLRMVHQARLKSVRHAPIYQFGYCVPRTPKEA